MAWKEPVLNTAFNSKRWPLSTIAARSKTSSSALRVSQDSRPLNEEVWKRGERRGGRWGNEDSTSYSYGFFPSIDSQAFGKL